MQDGAAAALDGEGLASVVIWVCKHPEDTNNYKNRGEHGLHSKAVALEILNTENGKAQKAEGVHSGV